MLTTDRRCSASSMASFTLTQFRSYRAESLQEPCDTLPVVLPRWQERKQRTGESRLVQTLAIFTKTASQSHLTDRVYGARAAPILATSRPVRTPGAQDVRQCRCDHYQSAYTRPIMDALILHFVRIKQAAPFMPMVLVERLRWIEETTMSWQAELA